MSQSPMLVADVNLSEEFNQIVDVYSLMPVLSVPMNVRVRLSSVTLGVLQVALRERSVAPTTTSTTLLSEQKDCFQTTQYLICHFAEIVKEAYRFLFLKLGDHKLGTEEILDRCSLPLTAGDDELTALKHYEETYRL